MFGAGAIGRLFVSIGADVQEFDRSMAQVEQRTRAAAQTAQQSVGAFERIGSSLGDVAKNAAGVALGMAALPAIRGVVDMVGGSIIGMNSQLEKSRLQFQTLLGDADAAAVHVRDLFRFAAETPFETGPIIEASRLLLTFGGRALDTSDSLRLVGDAAAATGATIDEVAFWFGRAYSQIQAGKPFGEAAMRLQELGILSAQGRQKLEELTDSGASATTIYAALRGEFERFDGAMKLQADTWEGLTSTISDNVKMMAAEAFLPLFERLKDGARVISEFVQSEGFQVWAGRISAAIDVVLDGVGSLARGFWNSLTSVLDVVSSVGEAIWEALQWLNPFATHSPALVDQVREGLEDIKRQFGSVTEIAGPLEAAGAAVLDFGGKGKEGLKALEDALDNTKGVVEDLRDSLRNAEADLKGWAATPLEGGKAYRDQLQALQDAMDRTQMRLNEMKMAQPKLVAPPSGADKEARKAYDDAARAQKDALRPLEEALERLRLQADNLRLQERLELDPLRRSLKDLANPPAAEMPFSIIARGITLARDKINELTPKLHSAEDAYDAFSKLVKDTRDALSEQTKAAAGAGKAVGAAASSMKDAVNPIQKVGESVAETRKEFDKARANIEKRLNEIRSTIEGFAAPFRSAWDNLWQGWSTAGIGGVLGAAGEVGEQIAGWLGEQFAKVDWGKVWSNVAVTADTIVAWLGNAAGAITGWLGEQWAKIDWEKVWSTLTVTVETVTGWLGEAAGAITGWLGAQWVKIDWSKVWDAITVTAETVGEWLGDIGGALLGWLQQTWAKIDWQQVWTWTLGIGKAFEDTVGPITANVTEWLKKGWATIDWTQVWAATEGGDKTMARWIDTWDTEASAKATYLWLKGVIFGGVGAATDTKNLADWLNPQNVAGKLTIAIFNSETLKTADVHIKQWIADFVKAFWADLLAELTKPPNTESFGGRGGEPRGAPTIKTGLLPSPTLLGQSMPISGRTAGLTVQIGTINAPGGDPVAVRDAARLGVLSATRALGITQ